MLLVPPQMSVNFGLDSYESWCYASMNGPHVMMQEERHFITIDAADNAALAMLTLVNEEKCWIRLWSPLNRLEVNPPLLAQIHLDCLILDARNDLELVRCVAHN